MRRKNNNTESEIFYREGYRKGLRWVVMLMILAVGLTVGLIGVDYTRPSPQFFATTPGGDVIPMHSLSEPMVTTNFLLEWASLAVRAAYNLDFVNYQTQLSQARTYFTDQGWSAFMAALNASGILSTIQNQKLQATAVGTGSPIVLQREIISGRFSWVVQLPLLVTYVSASETRKQQLVITLTIMRVSTLDTAQGILINDFN